MNLAINQLLKLFSLSLLLSLSATSFGLSDLLGPELKSITFYPTSVDVTKGRVVFSVEITAVDESQIDWQRSHVYFTTPTGTNLVVTNFSKEAPHVATVILDESNLEGTYRINNVNLYDEYGNEANFFWGFGEKTLKSFGIPETFSLKMKKDADGDGVADNADAFPDDPAASKDTDKDGKPDEWNAGKTQADSNSSPKLVLDNDNDNDGVEDTEALGCSSSASLILNGEDFVDGGVISDTPAGVLDLCGVFGSAVNFNAEGFKIAGSEYVYFKIELSNDASFAENIGTLTITGIGKGSTALFSGGYVGSSGAIYQVDVSNNSSANQTYKVDVRAITVQDEANVQVSASLYETLTEATKKYGTSIERTTATYIDFTLVDGDDDGIADNIDAFPNDASETTDSDGDGVGNNADFYPNDATASAYTICKDTSLSAKLASASTLPIEARLVVANPASNNNQQTFVRFVNPSAESVDVELYGTDDSGIASKSPPVSFSLAAGESKQMNAQDLEDGNAAKGLESSMCDGTGKWQITARSSKAIQIMGLIRTPDGFLTGLTDVVPVESGSNIVYFANPASTSQQQTFLRIVNNDSVKGDVTITATDNLGVAASSSVSFELAANGSKQMTAQDLENGNEAKGLTGKLGDGTGKWRLTIASSLDLSAQSLIRTPDGFLTNLSALVTPNASGTSTLNFFNPASNTAQQSFMRLVNAGTESSAVTISAVDDAGQIAPNGDVSLTLAAGQSTELSASDLEQGNTNLQLIGSLGVGSGRWRLDVSSDPQISVMSYVLTSTGFLTNMSEVVGAASTTNTVWIFNPGSNSNQASKLRVINSGSDSAAVNISGIDDAGEPSPGTNLTFNLSGGSVKEITAAELENGSSEKGLAGGIGDGKGKWRLTVSSDASVTVQSLLETPAGFITNLSTSAQ